MDLRPSTLENMEINMNKTFWRKKKVFLTGHTGFKGGWLALWLSDLGAEVFGYSLNPPTTPNFFTVCNLYSKIKGSTIADIRDEVALVRAMQAAEPEIVIHLAAQPLVRYSYNHPVETYTVNVIGTVNLMEAVRRTTSVRALVNITSDKCYENREWLWAYRENEPMGGYDPYSSSKGCTELITTAYRRSFMESVGIHLASARAGNVIGGGDWAADRLVPDFFRAWDSDQKLLIRFPNAIRPWQHVLEPLSGYLTLAEKLFSEGKPFAEAWNFGPENSDARSVEWVVEYLSKQTGSSWHCPTGAQPHEAHYLKLDISKAKHHLGWQPRWNIVTALDRTLDWHQAWKGGKDMAVKSLDQIREYEASDQR
jgi:CDP-glucose 4,6-dehydratase